MENRKETLARVLRFAKPYRWYLLAALVSAVLSVSLTLYAPVLIGRGIDQIIAPGKVYFDNLLPILIELGIVAVLAAIFQWLLTLCTNIVTYKTVRDLRSAAFEHMEELPLSNIDSRPHGDIISRIINDIDSVSDGLLQGFSQLFTGIITIAITLVYMLAINFKVGLVVVVITPLSLFVASFIAKHSFDMFRRQSAIKGQLSGCIEELVGNQKVVKAFSYEERAQQQFDRINHQLYDVGVKAQFYSSLTNPCTRFVNGVVYAAVAIVGALSCIAGGFSVGALSSFLTYANQYTKPFNEISGVITELQTAIASAKRVFDIIDEPVQQPDEPDAAHPTGCEGQIEIDRVSFSYEKSHPLIRDFHLQIKPGQRIALVGPTGCGKTTMINLLMRFYDVDAGEIRVDGQPIKKIGRDSLRSLYGMVLQDTWMFKGSVRDNIAYGKPDATDEEVVAAAKAAHAHSFIMRLPQGYDTVLAEDGGNISQGQKQLLCIARAMLTKPSMLILDEATSSIDTRTEIKIQQAFAQMMEGHTSFVVAHRLSTIREADCILVMKDGQIIEQGTHQQLLEKKGFYHQLYNSQFIQTEA
ncbi:MAG: ABC transporter ATP-binding protein [Clostridium sp.]|mgnify:FL=1|jgi:ATP-binding cassette subfamily B multidrug efflux pump|nr:ABC transporter ATP-binding protein [Clostridium sp.]